jgi:hypothetical protein
LLGECARFVAGADAPEEVMEEMMDEVEVEEEVVVGGVQLHLSMSNLTGYKGVSRDRRGVTKPFLAQSHQVDGRRHHLGYYATAQEAAVAYARFHVKTKRARGAPTSATEQPAAKRVALDARRAAILERGAQAAAAATAQQRATTAAATTHVAARGLSGSADAHPHALDEAADAEAADAEATDVWTSEDDALLIASVRRHGLDGLLASARFAGRSRRSVCSRYGLLQRSGALKMVGAPAPADALQAAKATALGTANDHAVETSAAAPQVRRLMMATAHALPRSLQSPRR